MSEIRFLTSSDEHIADKNKNPGFRKDDYASSILEKIEHQGKIAKKFGVNAILRGGDFFHVKEAHRNSMHTMECIARLHSNFDFPTYSLSGNHDMSYNDIFSIPNQPIGVLYAAGIFKNLQDQVFESGSLKVRVVGVDYTPDLTHDQIISKVKKKDENYTVAVIHALAAMEPEEKIQSFFNEQIFDYRDLVFNGCPDVYIFGHYHKDQGIVDHNGIKFVNLGSISRGSLTFENIERKPKVSLMKINSSGISIEEHIIPHKDASEVFDLEKKRRLTKERKSLDDFVSMLNSKNSSNSGSDIELMKKELDSFPEDFRKLALEVLETAQSGELD